MMDRTYHFCLVRKHSCIKYNNPPPHFIRVAGRGCVKLIKFIILTSKMELQRDQFESKEEFASRKQIVELLTQNYPDFGQQTVLTLSRLYINKMKLGVTYDDDVELILKKIK